MNETDLQKLQNLAETLITSLRVDWRDLSDISKTPAEKEDVRLHIQWCLEELEGLWAQIAEIVAAEDK